MLLCSFFKFFKHEGAPGGCDAVLLKSMRTPREQGRMRQLGDGGPGVSWARASGGDFSTGSRNSGHPTTGYNWKARRLGPGSETFSFQGDPDPSARTRSRRTGSVPPAVRSA